MRNSRAGKCIFCGKLWRKANLGKGAVYVRKPTYPGCSIVVLSCENHVGVTSENVIENQKVIKLSGFDMKVIDLKMDPGTVFKEVLE